MHSNVFTLITGRTKSQAQSMEYGGKFSSEYRESVAVAFMNPDDIAALGIKDKALLRSNDRRIVVSVRADPSVPRGLIFIPWGPYANALIPPRYSIGMPRYKGVAVSVEPFDEGVERLEPFDWLSRRFIYMGRDLEVFNGLEKHYTTAACTFCGLVCDNIIVAVSGNRVVEVLEGCSISNSKFVNFHRNRVVRPVVRVGNGGFAEVDIDTAIDRAVDILVKSGHPLIYGLSCTTNEAIEVAIELAKTLRGAIDSTASLCHGPTLLGLEGVDVEIPKLDLLGDLDIAIIWGANPVEAHPKLIPILKKRAKIITIDVRVSETTKISDMCLLVRPGEDLELARAIRAMLRGISIDRESVAGVSIDSIRDLVYTLKSARKGAVFVGMGLTMSRTRLGNTIEVAMMVRDLNRFGKWYLLPLRGHFNVTGTNILMKRATGYPYAVDFAYSEPIMFPGVTTAVDLIKNRDVDAVLVIASDPAAHMPIECVKALSEMPLIVIDSRWSLTASMADVVIPAGMTGIECGGTVYRMDGELVEAKKILDGGLICDADILRAILEKVKERLGV